MNYREVAYYKQNKDTLFGTKAITLQLQEGFSVFVEAGQSTCGSTQVCDQKIGSDFVLICAQPLNTKRKEKKSTSLIEKQYLRSAWRLTPTPGGAEMVECITDPKTATSFSNISNATPTCLPIYKNDHVIIVSLIEFGKLSTSAIYQRLSV